MAKEVVNTTARAGEGGTSLLGESSLLICLLREFDLLMDVENREYRSRKIPENTKIGLEARSQPNLALPSREPES